ncbi:hypothetical protein [Polyangium jinanense]|uniref:Uncharacterized protein n=1 Tax=Polyangium jinanense TaxID=2829994 RepID=A0A9X3XFK3_9BACT|nr:hypothetical protein [Polyangium jinanense]MDC3958176.1 hypothetical protein [Polyangium jinanense]MDC3988138.1 hypothetical protein [Polyangium jinanense]
MRDRILAACSPLVLLFLCAPSLARAEIPVCVRLPGHPKMDRFALSGSATVITKDWAVFTAKTNGLTVFVYDPYAPPENVRFLPPPHNKLKCPAPPPRPKPAPAKTAPKAPAEESKAGTSAPVEDAESQKPPPQQVKDMQGDVVPPGVKKMPERPPEKPQPAPQGVLSNEPLLPTTSTLPKRDEVHPPKCVDEACTLVDRGGALPERVFRPGAPVSSVASCEQTKEGCKARKEKTRAGAILEQVVIAGAIFNLQMNEDLYRPDGKEYGIVGGMNADGPNDPRLQAAAAAVMFSPVAMALGNKFMKATSEALERGEKVVIKNVSELSEDAAKYLAEEFGEELTKALAQAEVIGPFRVMRHFTTKHGGAWQAHHIYETKKMLDIGLDALDGPSVILSEEAHTVVTNELRNYTLHIPGKNRQALWKAYEEAYKKSPHWLKAIAHYFEK